MSPTFGDLRRTPDFISYVWPIDAAEPEIVELTRRTVPAVNGQLIARALHALRPRQFPLARFSETTNHLSNPEDFQVVG